MILMTYKMTYIERDKWTLQKYVYIEDLLLTILQSSGYKRFITYVFRPRVVDLSFKAIFNA